MATKYPAQIDNSISLPLVIDNSTPIKASTINNLRNAIVAIQSELGTKPRSTYGTVSARLDYLEGILNISQTILLAGDLGGTASIPKVIGIQGIPISSTTPTANQILKFNGVSWAPATPTSLITFSNDLSGNDTNQTVVGLQSTSIDDNVPVDKQVLQYLDGYSAWVPALLNTNDLTPPLGIDISSTQYVQVGATITPSFTFNYNFTPTEVIYSDSEGNVDVNINAPFVSFTSPYSYTKSTYGSSVTITITASNENNSVSETYTIRWVQKVYYGLNASTTLSEAFIEALSNSSLYYNFSEIEPLAIDASSGYWHFAIRSAHDKLFFIINKIAGGISKVGEVSVTNSNGFAENYSLFKTDNSALGDLFVELETSNYTYS